MPEITRKRTGTLLRKLFEILKAHPEGVPSGEALKRLVIAAPPTDYESGVYESTGDRRFERIVRFATIDCVKAGWLIKNKGTWSLTDAGLKAYKEFTDPEAFHKEAVRLYGVWYDNREGQTGEILSDDKNETAASASEKTTSITFEQATEQAWTEIERYLRAIDPYAFQKLVENLLTAMGYYVSWNAPPGKDGGVDIIAHTDPIGTRPPRIKVQVKRRADRIDVDGLRSFMSLIGDDDVGIFVSTGGFTRDAEEFARSQERRKITLINLDRFVDLWTEHYIKLGDEARQRLPLTPIYFLTPRT